MGVELRHLFGADDRLVNSDVSFLFYKLSLSLSLCAGKRMVVYMSVYNIIHCF